MLVHLPNTEANSPNLKLVSPLRGPRVVRSRLSPVIYLVFKGEQPEKTSVHLARIKLYYAQFAASAPDYETIYDLLGNRLLPEIDNV